MIKHHTRTSLPWISPSPLSYLPVQLFTAASGRSYADMSLKCYLNLVHGPRSGAVSTARELGRPKSTCDTAAVTTCEPSAILACIFHLACILIVRSTSLGVMDSHKRTYLETHEHRSSSGWLLTCKTCCITVYVFTVCMSLQSPNSNVKPVNDT